MSRSCRKTGCASRPGRPPRADRQVAFLRCNNWPNSIIDGTAAVPVTTAGVAQSLQQLIATCTGVTTSVTGSVYGVQLSSQSYYMCSIPAQVGMAHRSVIAYHPNDGYWQYTGEGFN